MRTLLVVVGDVLSPDLFEVAAAEGGQGRSEVTGRPAHEIRYIS